MKQQRGTTSKTTKMIYLTIIMLVVGIAKIFLLFAVNIVEPGRMFSPDSVSYINTARAFQQTGRFAVSPERADVPQLIRTPGYPYFIAGSFCVFGEYYAPLIALQILLSLGILAMVYYLSNMLWGAISAFPAVILLSLDIPSFISSQHVLTETLFTFVLCVTILLAVSPVKQAQRVYCVATLQGLFLACATLIRPIAYYLIIPIVLTNIIFFRADLKLSWKKVAAAALLLVTPYILIVGSWQIRNYQHTGKAEFSYIQGFNLLFYRGAGIIAQRDGISFREAQQFLGYKGFVQLTPEQLPDSIVELNQQWIKESFQLFFKYPTFLLKDQFRGFLQMMFMPGEEHLLELIGDYQENSGPIGDFFKLSLKAYIKKWLYDKPGHFFLFLFAESSLMLLYLSIALSIRHLVSTKDDSWRIHFILWGVIVYFIIISAGPEAYSRFRIPIMPLLAIYGGHGLYLTIEKLHTQRA